MTTDTRTKVAIIESDSVGFDVIDYLIERRSYRMLFYW